MIYSSAETIRIPAEMLISYPKSPQLVVLLGLLLRRLKGSIRFDQLEGLQKEEPDGKKEVRETFCILQS